MHETEIRQVNLTTKTVSTLCAMGLAYPVGSEERAAAMILASKFAKAPIATLALQAVDAEAA